MFKRLLKILSIGVLSISLAGCQKDSIIDLIHADTEKMKISEEVFSDDAYKPYVVGEVLFMPYMRHAGFEKDEEGNDYTNFTLKLAAYKQQDNMNTILINSIKIVGTKDVNFEEITKDLALPLEFTADEELPSIQLSDNVLFEKINGNKNLNLTDNSMITVAINVSVTADTETITKDLTYEFNTRIRTYSVQR
ncbi:hypothetical protein [Neobacillus vireti]|uniref:hypothetical protein n=1 Tax=Neobacillus vireti TaxID=220686 RepID=UPI002FFEA628